MVFRDGGGGGRYSAARPAAPLLLVFCLVREGASLLFHFHQAARGRFFLFCVWWWSRCPPSFSECGYCTYEQVKIEIGMLNKNKETRPQGRRWSVQRGMACQQKLSRLRRAACPVGLGAPPLRIASLENINIGARLSQAEGVCSFFRPVSILNIFAQFTPQVSVERLSKPRPLLGSVRRG